MPAASIPISGNSSTTIADPDAELMALVEQRDAAWQRSGEVDDDDQADAAYEEMDRLDALIAATAAGSLAGIFAKARLYTGVAASDAEEAQPLLRSLMRDLFRVPLNDETGLRAVFATLAAPLSAGLLKDVTILLKPVRSRLSDDEWSAALDRCVDALRDLDTCRDIDRLARQVFEPLRQKLGEDECARAAGRLADELSEMKYQQGRQAP